MEQLPRLALLGGQCGQASFLDGLPYFLATPQPDARAPRSKVLKLLSKEGGGRLRYAVLFYEYYVYGVPTRVFVPADLEGWRTTIAPPHERARAAVEAAEFLIARGANVVLANYAVAAADPQPDPGDLAPRPVGSRTREVRRVLPLGESFDATLAPMGAHTRRNLRAAQRRVATELGAKYFARAELSLAEFLGANRACVYTVPEWVAEWRYSTARNRVDGVFAGLRDARGQWLSLLGGHRSHGTVFVDWQMNLQSSGALSLGSATRAFFIADEVARGMRWMRFEGGTPHSMNSAFLKERVHDLVFARRGLRGRAVLQALARVLPADGVLAEVLLGEELVWCSAQTTASEQH